MIAEGSAKLASVPSGGGGGGAAAPTASGGAAPAAAAVEEKEEEKEVRARDALIPITTFSRSRILTGLPNYRSPTRIWALVSSTKQMFITNEPENKKKWNLRRFRGMSCLRLEEMLRNLSLFLDWR